MKKTLFGIILLSLVHFSGYCQTYNPVNYNFNGTPTYGVKIKTNIPFCNFCQMPTMIFEGYNYGSASTIGISLVYYIYGGDFYQPKASSWGGYTPVIKLANENNKVIIFIDDRVYYQRFSIRVFAQGMSEDPSWFQGWTVADESISGSNITTVPYKNNFSGNIYFPGSSIWTSEGKIGVGTLSPGSKLELYQESADNSNLIMASLNRGGTMTGGSNILRIGYYATSDLEQNGMYSSSGWRYGSWADLNIVNNGYSTYGGINLVTQANVRMSILPNGNIGIGTTNPQNKLDVNGIIRAKEIKATLDNWSDYVFEEGYKLPSLSEVESYIKTNKHLQDIPSAEDVTKDGVNLGDMQTKLLRKIEELTLYIIDQNRKNELQSREIEMLKQEIALLKGQNK